MELPLKFCRAQVGTPPCENPFYGPIRISVKEAARASTQRALACRRKRTGQGREHPKPQVIGWRT
jgi:hypothetical protein